MSDGSSFPLDYGPLIRPPEQLPVFAKNKFVDVSSCVVKTTLNPKIVKNSSLAELIPGWPNPDPAAFCHFAVPDSYKGKSIKHNVHIGSGRAISTMGVNIPGSRLAQELARNEKAVSSVTRGVHDTNTGFFYTDIGTKGNGPTADEMARVEGLLEGADHRLNDAHKTWGIYCDETALTVELPGLELLEQIGFRASKIIASHQLDGSALANQVDPIYKASGLNYSVADELRKIEDEDLHPGIAVRLTAGVKADVLNHPDAHPDLVTSGIYSLCQEIKIRGVQDFLKYYRAENTNLHKQLEAIQQYNYPEPLTPNVTAAYLAVISFLMQRNYYLQDEYNAKKQDKHLGKPLWLNYKPGDWDVGGFLYDVDVSSLKRHLAKRRGEDLVRENDNDAIGKGLQAIGEKLSQVGTPHWRDLIVYGRDSAKYVHTKHKGFLHNKKLPDYDFNF